MNRQELPPNRGVPAVGHAGKIFREVFDSDRWLARSKKTP